MRAADCPVATRVTPIDGGLAVAPAKLNLDLRVLGRRADGFHELDSIVARVSLYDELTIRVRDDGRIRLECPDLPGLAAEDNLAWRAAERLANRARGRGAEIALTKRIPPGAGLGGGSSDAAAVLKTLNELWALGLSVEELAGIGGELGSDVPLFFARRRRESAGGERSWSRPRWVRSPRCWSCRSCTVRRPKCTPPGTPRDPLRPTGSRRPDMSGPPSAWRGGLVNDLAPAAAAVRPQLGELVDLLASETGQPVHVTGSGSGLFILADDPTEAGRTAALVPDELSDRTFIVRQNPW